MGKEEVEALKTTPGSLRFGPRTRRIRASTLKQRAAESTALTPH